jgi:uncharacterized protein YdaU (DUF1376 family)
MSKPSHIPLFPDAYLRDNYRLTLEQHGLFLMLMMEAWGSEDCTLPDDEKQLAEIAGIAVAKFRKIAPAVLARWTREGGRLHQKRLLKEWHYVREKSAKRKAAADARWMQSPSKCNANAMHLGGGGGEGGGGGSSGISSAGISDGEPFA